MNLLDSLTPVARRIAERLLEVHPQFEPQLVSIVGGNFEASIPAPHGSHAGALVVCTAGDSDIWVHFAPAQMWYAVDDEDEMLSIVDRLLRDEVLFARTVNASNAWVETTLVRGGHEVRLKDNETATVLSWSGRRDEVLYSQ